MSRLPAIVKVLKETSFYHTSKLADADMALLVKMLKSWPSKMMFPGLYCTLLGGGGGGGGGALGGGSAAGCKEGLHSAAARGYFEVWLGWVGLGRSLDSGRRWKAGGGGAERTEEEGAPRGARRWSLAEAELKIFVAWQGRSGLIFCCVWCVFGPEMG
jgi:hypothetical protein